MTLAQILAGDPDALLHAALTGLEWTLAIVGLVWIRPMLGPGYTTEPRPAEVPPAGCPCGCGAACEDHCWNESDWVDPCPCGCDGPAGYCHNPGPPGDP